MVWTVWISSSISYLERHTHRTVDVLSRIGAHAVPEGDAAAQLFDDEAGQRVLILPGEDQGLDADVLLCTRSSTMAVKKLLMTE